MENYKLVDKLREGYRTIVFTAKDIRKRGDFVIKKVECDDESQVTTVIAEAEALKALKHPHICKYWEFFGSYNKAKRAVFACAVTDYYKKGHLGMILDDYRMQKRSVELPIMKAWTGQMIEALAYIHERKIIHRNLKPSNVLVQDNGHLAIGDFELCTMVNGYDEMTQTGVRFWWIAPEALEDRPRFDERSDIWSLGCVLLAAATCDLLEPGEVAANLVKIKMCSETVEKLVALVAQVYYDGFGKLLWSFLRLHFRHRPTSGSLLDSSYVQDCMTLYNSPSLPVLLGLANKQESIVAKMKRSNHSTDIQLSCLHQLLDIEATGDRPLDTDAKTHIAQMVTRFSMLPEIQSLCLKLLCHFITKEGLDIDAKVCEELTRTLCRMLREKSAKQGLLSAAAELLLAIAVNEELTPVMMGKLGGLDAALSPLVVVECSSLSPPLISSCCTLLMNLCTSRCILSAAVQRNAVQIVYRLLQTHPDSLEVVDAACSALWSLSLSAVGVSHLINLEAHKMFLKMTAKYKNEAGVVKFTAAALSSICETTGDIAFSLFDKYDGKQGLQIIMEALKSHLSDSDVAEQIGNLLCVVTKHDETHGELQAQNVVKVFAAVVARLSPNEDLSALLQNLKDNCSSNKKCAMLPKKI